MHSFNASKDLLISAPSSLVCLFMSMVSAPRSQPARSMKESFPNTFFPSRREMERMAWEREESELVEFWDVMRRLVPSSMTDEKSATLVIFR